MKVGKRKRESQLKVCVGRKGWEEREWKRQNDDKRKTKERLLRLHVCMKRKKERKRVIYY